MSSADKATLAIERTIDPTIERTIDPTIERTIDPTIEPHHWRRTPSTVR